MYLGTCTSGGEIQLNSEYAEKLELKRFTDETMSKIEASRKTCRK